MPTDPYTVGAIIGILASFGIILVAIATVCASDVPDDDKYD